MLIRCIYISASIGLYFVLESWWSTACRSTVLSVLDFFSSAALAEDGGLQIAHVHIPWSQACSGLNALAVMMGLSAWSTLSTPVSAYWRRMGLAVGIAFGINVARSLSIAAARVILAPSWEGEGVHFFLGFLWIAAGVALFARSVPVQQVPPFATWVHTACVLAAISVVESWPGGTLAAACGLTCLFATAGARARQESPIRCSVWLVCGVLIAWSQMESLWLPWLLASQNGWSNVVRRSPAVCIVWLGTIPVLSMQPFAWWLMAPALALTLYSIVYTEEEGFVESTRRSWIPVLASVGIPFILPHIIGASAAATLPSPALMPRSVSESAYLVRAHGQPADLAVLWFDGSDGRHHSVESCLALRGILLERFGSVIRRDDVWLTEYFIQADTLHPSYASYLLSTLAPWSSAGVHLVFESPVESMDHNFFAKEAARTAATIQRIAARHASRHSQPNWPGVARSEGIRGSLGHALASFQSPNAP